MGCRSSRKGPFYDKSVLQCLLNVHLEKHLIWSRRSCITPDHVGKTFEVRTSNSFSKLTVKEEMVGKKFGEFAPTRKKALHGKKNTKKR